MTDPTTVPIIDADDCDVNARFVNRGQNGKCVCNPGFTGDGIECQGIVVKYSNFLIYAQLMI